MSIDEAISVLKMVEAHGLADEAKNMAIRSLEAWKNVERMIKQQERNVSPKILENQVFVMSYGVIKGIYEGVKDE